MQFNDNTAGIESLCRCRVAITDRYGVELSRRDKPNDVFEQTLNHTVHLRGRIDD